LARLSAALRVARGDEARATYPLQFPGGGQSAAIVRSANPQEYKGDGAGVRVQGFSKHPVVHACIRVVADIIASVPLKAMRSRGDWESVVPESDPLQMLLDYPGPRFTARQLRAGFAVDMLGYGNAMVQMERPTGGKIAGLRRVNPEAIQSVWVDAEGDARLYQYGDWSGRVMSVPSENMIHVRDLEMGAPFTPDVFGFPRGATALASLLADNEATQYVRQVVTNDGTPTFAILMHDEATQEDAAAVQARYVERMVNRGNRGKPAVFGGVKDIRPLGFTLSDLEFPDLRRVSREDICAAFGVDPRMIGIASATSDAGLSGTQYVEARARLVQHTIEPLMSAIEDELNHWLAPEYGERWIAFDKDTLRDMVEDDLATSTRIQAEFKASLRTWEESRRALKLSPVPEPTDTLLSTAGNTLIPAAVAVINPEEIVGEEGTESEVVGSIAPTEDVQGQALNGAQVTSLVEMLTQLANEQLPPDAVEALIKVAFPAVPDALVAQLLGAMKGFTPAEQESGTAPMKAEEPEDDSEDERSEQTRSDAKRDIWERAVKELTARDEAYYARARSSFRKESKLVKAAFSNRASDFTALRKEIRKLYGKRGPVLKVWEAEFEKVVRDSFKAGIQRVASTGTVITVDSPLVQQAIRDNTTRLASFITEDTARQVLAAMRASEVAGLSIGETAKLIQASVFGEQMTDMRATRIARTENANATNRGAWMQAEEAGIYRSKEWLAFTDNDTRDTHSANMDMGIVPLDFAYSGEKGASLQFPGDPSGGPEDVINCRCVLAYYDEEAKK
jgi:HK97 family phage portal protein